MMLTSKRYKKTKETSSSNVPFANRIQRKRCCNFEDTTASILAVEVKKNSYGNSRAKKITI